MATHGKRRALGQHFLKDESIARLIADNAVAEAIKNNCARLLEIGPGKGAITHPILNALKNQTTIQHFAIVEKDRELAHYWREYTRELTTFSTAQVNSSFSTSVEEADFVQLPEAQWLTRTPLVVVSNLPYSAGTAILTRIARHPEKVLSMTLMFQAEVAQRLRAESNTKSWGSLSIWIQNRWDVKLLCAVPPRAFSPPPEVNSEVVSFTPRREPRVAVARDEASEALWESLLKTSFLHRRKMLRSGLPAQDGFRNALALSTVDGTKRAEALTWEEWNRLYQALRTVRAS